MAFLWECTELYVGVLHVTNELLHQHQPGLLLVKILEHPDHIETLNTPLSWTIFTLSKLYKAPLCLFSLSDVK